MTLNIHIHDRIRIRCLMIMFHVILWATSRRSLVKSSALAA